jgi:hypothetical protein
MKLETWRPKTNFKFNSENAKYILAFLVLILLIPGGIKMGKIMNEYVYWQETKDKDLPNNKG